ncbi:CbtB-domain containing protein [Micromonospora sp. WMMD987]|jgi:hypothetical protein|uniref:CbtB domain-containing protein n=1 Tax=Micromonospora TaxID=1873 RepID=UPI00249AF772|nr:CbtB-domain containing protein [Micromonospora sp. WMMD987]WFE93163.1 CbtB-domain containing protein [Micromonospora sp. WMMD987]
MSSSTPAQPLVHPVGSARLWGAALLVVGVLLLLTYLVAFDQGAVSRSGMYLHELMHDGRHLLGVPCH